MLRKYRKALLIVAKLVVAGGLLGWVLTLVDWHDFVVARADGKRFAVLEAHPSFENPRELTVSRGMLWWRQQERRPVGDFSAVSSGGPVIRQGFAATMRNIRVPLLALAAAGFLGSYLTVATRWWFLLRIQDIHISLWEAVRLTFLGIFFNSIVPGTVGGDLVKAYYVARHTPKKAAVLVSIFVDRIMGLTELTLMAAVMTTVVLVCGLERLETIRNPVISIAVCYAWWCWRWHSC
jgi:hypothetical protein